MSMSTSMSMSMSKIDEGVRVYFSILLASYFMWSTVLDSSDLLQSYCITSLASHITNILTDI